ncbi:uncharacterized protein LOC132276754 isoform X2 [Cornus florida]|uniref:uncharacterized protein LOC132276754 isoform X2 n=1 Tax=Cornus florida TaxID=4283 RepID=UPI0028A03E42|nr:uncharacterized protein LOC132276754 isoform X2 [Cornus florida]
MSQLAKVRFVLCPNCKKVLPEHTNHSVYKCGGCDTLLQSKKGVAEAETSPDKSDEGKIGGVTASKRVTDLFLFFISYKIRLVGCPKCRNLLPEPTNYSVFKCGGCGAVLRAKKRVAGAETSSHKFDEGKIGGISEKFLKKSGKIKFSEKGMVNSSDGSEHDVKSNGSCSSRAENGEVVLSDRVEEYKNGLNLGEFTKMGKEVDELKPPNWNVNGFQRLVGTSDPRIRVRDEMEGLWRNPRMVLDFDGVRYSTSKYTQEGEGPSSYQFGGSSSSSAYGGEPVNETDGIQKVVQDRAELLLRKLDELKDQFSGCCDVNDKRKGKLPFEHYIDDDMDPFESYSHNINLHLPSSSCFHCYTKRPPPAFYNKMYPGIPNNPMLYHHENSRLTNPHNPQSSYTRWPRELNSEVSGFVPRVVLATGARHCRPIAAGAPFITCYNCLGLLQLPDQVLFVEKNKMKIRCGECSTVILFALVNKKAEVNKKLLVSLNAETKRSPTTKVDGSTDVAVNEVGNG